MARRIAKDLGVDIEQVHGTGPGGRVVEADIRAFAELRKLPVTSPTPAKSPSAPTPTSVPVATPAGDNGFRFQELTPIQRITGERMRESVMNAPQFALDVSADATNLLWLQEALERSGYPGGTGPAVADRLLIKITAAVLLQYPYANAEFAGGKIKLIDFVNMGVAIGTDRGLIVPVIKDCSTQRLGCNYGRTGRFSGESPYASFRG